MQPTGNNPVRVSPPIARIMATIGLISGTLVFVWGLILIAGAFFGRTAAFATVIRGFAFFLIICFICTAISAIIDDAHKSQESRAEAKRLERTKQGEPQTVRA